VLIIFVCFCARLRGVIVCNVKYVECSGTVVYDHASRSLTPCGTCCPLLSGVSLNHLVTERLADGVGFGSTISNSVIFGSTSASSCSASLACHAMVRAHTTLHKRSSFALVMLTCEPSWLCCAVPPRLQLCAPAVTHCEQAPGDVRGVGCNSVFGPTWRHVGVVSSQYLNKGKLCISDIDGGGGTSHLTRSHTPFLRLPSPVLATDTHRSRTPILRHAQWDTAWESPRGTCMATAVTAVSALLWRCVGQAVTILSTMGPVCVAPVWLIPA
jgi:hypothetical protein